VAVKASLVLVGDIGGTNARLSLWETKGGKDATEVHAKSYETKSSPTFDNVVESFLNEGEVSKNRPEAASLAIAGAVVNNTCNMTNCPWVIDGPGLEKQFGFKTALLNDFQAVGYGIPALDNTDIVTINQGEILPKAPKVVMGPGTGLGAAQLMWDSGKQAYSVWPGEGAHATFAPRGWKQRALAGYAEAKFGGHVEIEHVACGSGLALIYEFLLSDEESNKPGLHLLTPKEPKEITSSALDGSDPVAVEAVDMFMSIVGAEAGAMSLRCLAKGGVYIAGGITPRLLPHLQASPTKGGALLEGFLCRAVRTPFKELLESMPLAVITNDKVGQIGAREYARLLAANAL